MIVVHQRQPTDTSCGQTVLAMIVGEPAQLVLAEVPGRPKIGTLDTDLRAFLRTRGYLLAGRLRCGALPPGEVAIVRTCPVKPPGETIRSGRARRRRGHWVLWDGSRIWDPADSPVVRTVRRPYKVASWFPIGPKTRSP